MIWPTCPPGNPKPRIKLNMQGLYWCSDKATLRSGWGKTPKEAYADWLLRDSRRFMIARAGIWAKDQCRSWYRAGCPPISSYIGSRQIVSYLPASDQLVLRGAR